MNTPPSFIHRLLLCLCASLLGAWLSATPLHARQIATWDLTANGPASYATSIVTNAGHTHVLLPSLASLATATGLEELWIFNRENFSYPNFGTAEVTAVTNFVTGGGVLLFFDRRVTEAATVIPGAAGITCVRDADGGATSNPSLIDLDPSAPAAVVAGIDNTGFDGGNSSSHGVMQRATLPADAHVVLFREENVQHVVQAIWPVGGGLVSYSTVPADHYLYFNTGIAPALITMLTNAANGSIADISFDLAILAPHGSVVGDDIAFRAKPNKAVAATQVEFFAGGASIGTDTTADGSGAFETTFDTLAMANGPLTLRAVATFTDATTTERTTTVIVANPGPPVVFTAPTEGAIFSGDSNPIAVSGTDDAHLPVRVSFFRVANGNETPLGVDFDAPFTSTFSVSDLTPSTVVTIKAIASDSLDRPTTITVTGQAPGPLVREVFLQGDVVEVGFHRGGSIGTVQNAPAGFHPQGFTNLGIVTDTQGDGWDAGTPARTGDFVLPGFPYEGWAVRWGSTVQGNFGLGGSVEIEPTAIGAENAAGAHVATWEGTAGGGSEQLKVTQRVQLKQGDHFFTVHVVLENTGTTALDGVKYLRTVEPDPEAPLGGSFTTSNYVENDEGINQQLVVARGLTYPDSSVIGLGAIDPRAVVSFETSNVRDPNEVLDSPVTPPADNPRVEDGSIALAFDLGALAPGGKAEFEFAYLLADSDLAAALGIPLDVAILAPHGSVSDDDVAFRVKTNKAVAATQVEFFVGGSSIGVDSTPDIDGVFATTFNTNTRPNGQLLLRAVATFADATTAERTTKVVVANPGPPISFVKPFGGTAFAGNHNEVEVAGLDAGHPPARVRFSVQIGASTTDLGEDTSAPFTTTFSVVGYFPGTTVIVTAIGEDAAGRETRIDVYGYVAFSSFLQAVDDQFLVVGARATRFFPLANDESGGESVRIIAVTQGEVGRVRITGDAVTYTPRDPRLGGTDFFTYTIADSIGNESTATITVWFGDTQAGLYYSPLIFQGIFDGTLELKVGRLGTFTGRAFLSGRATALHGILRADGTATVKLPRPGEPPLLLHLQFDLAGGGLFATIEDESGNLWENDVIFRSPYDTVHPHPAVGQYTLTIGAPGESSLPTGNGWATIEVTPEGRAAVIGKLADSTPFSTAGVLVDHVLNLYAPLYAAPKGSLTGGLTFGSLPSVEGGFHWEKPAQFSPNQFYPAGFITDVYASGYAYDPPGVLRRPIVWPEPGLGFVYLSGGNLVDDIFADVRVDQRNIARVTAPITSLKIAPATGIVTGKFKHPVDRRIHNFSGIFLQSESRALGWFTGTFLGGYFELDPVTP